MQAKRATGMFGPQFHFTHLVLLALPLLILVINAVDDFPLPLLFLAWGKVGYVKGAGDHVHDRVKVGVEVVEGTEAAAASFGVC